MCINKLFVLPGTKLAEQMEKDGVVVGETSRDAMLNYYARLFWISSYSSNARRYVRAIEKIPLFKKRPSLLNPLAVKALMNPRWGCSVLKFHASQILKRAKGAPSVNASPVPDTALAPVESPACSP